MFNDFETIKRALKTILRIVLVTCKTVSRKPCINIEYKRNISKFSYTYIVVIIKMKFLAIVTPPSIYHNITLH